MYSDLELRLQEAAGVFNGIEILALVFLLVLASETVWDRFTGYRQSLSETGANLIIGLVYGLLERTAYGLILVIAVFLAEPFALWDLPMNGLTWVLAIVVADLTYYWMHRCEHRVRLFWTYHSVHHSSPEFNFTTALRLAWTEALFEWMFFIPMVIVGFDPVQVIAGLAVVVAYQSWIHTEKVRRLGWLECILNTPSHHRVHHGSNPEYLDKNYGGILIVWDRLFGTYTPERAKVIYGITDPLNTSNPITINFRDFIRLGTDARNAPSFAQALKMLMKPPGWTPTRDTARPADQSDTQMQSPAGSSQGEHHDEH
ncbi:sterol desaturase family protein [Roseibium aggregatum]|uniref:sterol desaturase family protein n=1 Tax=Roseibium aggregatum TaxID=187304 RepID=UPI001E505E42|nr:sterol desaturase family protein [Roseibium aggregatum]UES51933.1 sterol desaturase family protein [Roseibium aggregatum]